MKIPYVTTRAAFWLSVFCLAASPGVSLGGTPLPDAKSAMVIDAWSLPGILGGGVKSTDAYTEGSFFVTYPAYSSIGRDGWLSGDVFFIEPYTSWGEQGEVVASLGLGWRHLFTTQSTSAITRHDGHQAGFFEEGGFIGANLFVDMLDTQYDNRFWQLGFGIEAGTRYLEARANYYLPLTDRQLAEEIRTQQSFTTRSTVESYEEPFGTGHTIQQDVTLTTFATTTTIERLFRRYEDGMEGWDAELALLLPWVDRWMDVKLIAGYYAFDNQPFGPQAGGTGNVEGWKAGLEVRPVPAVVLNATWYEDDRLTGGDWVAGIRLELPFEAGDLGDGKGFWGRLGDAFRPRRRHLAERMVEPVRRQNAAIKIASSVEEDKSAAEVKVVTKVVSQSKTRVVLADTVVFVDNTIGHPANPGTYEAPVDTIQGGENAGNARFGSRAIVMVQGRSQAYAENVTLSEGVRLFGSGSFGGLGGTSFHGRTSMMPHVSGGFLAQNIQGTVGIVGFEVTGGISGIPVLSGAGTTTSGITLQNVKNGIIAGNYVHHIGPSGAGIFVESSGPSAVSNIQISSNVVANSGDGIVIQADLLSRMEGRIAGNLITGNTGSGLNVLAGGTTGGGGGIGTFAIVGNAIVGNALGLIAGSTEGNGATFFIVSNVISDNGFGMTVFGNSGGTANVFLSNNTIEFNGGHQITGQDAGGTLNFISNGTLNNTVRETPGAPGFLYEAHSGDEAGFIFINGVLRPAGISLP